MHTLAFVVKQCVASNELKLRRNFYLPEINGACGKRLKNYLGKSN